MLIRWGEFDRGLNYLDDFRRQMDRLFDDYQTGVGRGTAAVANWPRVDFRDTGTSLTLTAELPGLSDKDVKLTVNQDVLRLEGERRVEAPKGYAVHRQERAPVRFARSFTLPCRVDPERTVAVVQNGVLTVTLPKAAEAQPRQITVKAG